MKKRTLPVILLLAFAGGLVAQTTKNQPKEKKKIVHRGTSYLAGGNITSGTISKKAFDSLIALPLIAKDTLGNERQVVDFVFSYAERGLYEDSTGRPMIVTDYLSVSCPGGRLPDEWVKMLHDRSKRGDTAYVDEVLAVYPDKVQTRFYTTPIKLVITE